MSTYFFQGFIINDWHIVVILLVLLVLSIYMLRKISDKEKIMENNKKNMVDLEAITKNIERDYKPLNIELTSYEQEQEKNAIISYDELVSTINNSNVVYDDRFKNEDDSVNIKKVDLGVHPENNTPVAQTKINVDVLRYDKEEAFLKALKQLQDGLVR